MRTKILLNLIFSLIGLSTFGQQNINTSSIDSIVSFYEDYYDFNGTIAVMKGKETIFKKGYGYANYEFGKKTNINSIYNIRSLTKGFTGVIIAEFIQNGKLKLDDFISTHLPEINGKAGNTVTIKHLLTHQSGLKPIDMKTEDRLTKMDYLKQLNEAEFLFTPGTEERYHDFNYYILGVIIERIEGKDLERVYDEKIFTPLGMNNTSLSDGESMVKNLVIPYYINQVDHSNKLHHVFPRITEVGYSFGGILSTIDDLHKWLEANHSDRFKQTSIKGFVDDKSKGRDMPFENKPDTVNLGGTEKRIFVGDGGGGGFRSLYYYYPDEDIYIIMLCNTYYFKPRGATGGLKYDVIPYLISQSIFTNDITPQKIPISKIIIDKLENDISIKTVIKEYQELKKNTDTYLFDVKQLNNAAYFCLDNKNEQEALELFSLNVKEYPENWIVYDGLGEYYFRTGNREKTIEYFEKSVKMNPNQWREERKMYDKRRNMLEIIDVNRYH